MVAHTRIAEKFAARKINRRTGDCSWCGSRIFSTGNTLYSYGTHFPLAKYLGDQAGEHVFLKNGDRYSSSTSGHQSITQSACPGPTVSRSALSAAGINFEQVVLNPVDGEPHVVSYRKDFREYIYRDEDGHYWKEMDYTTAKARRPTFSEPFKPPRQGMFVPHSCKDEDQHYKSGVWHILGAALIRRGNEDFLCSLDEGQYFVAQLPVRVNTIDQALKALKPAEARRAERAGKQVLRQGEWFFLPTGLDHKGFAERVGLRKTQLLELAKIAPLPQRPRPDQRADPRSRNMHCCRQYFVAGEGIYATGHVYHRNGWNNRVTNEHRTLKLGDQWYKVVLNTEVASWTVGGRFD